MHIYPYSQPNHSRGNDFECRKTYINDGRMEQVVVRQQHNKRTCYTYCRVVQISVLIRRLTEAHSPEDQRTIHPIQNGIRVTAIHGQVAWIEKNRTVEVRLRSNAEEMKRPPLANHLHYHDGVDIRMRRVTRNIRQAHTPLPLPPHSHI